MKNENLVFFMENIENTQYKILRSEICIPENIKIGEGANVVSD